MQRNALLFLRVKEYILYIYKEVYEGQLQFVEIRLCPPKVKDKWGKRFLGAETVQVQTHVLSAYQGLLESVINDKYMGGGG